MRWIIVAVIVFFFLWTPAQATVYKMSSPSGAYTDFIGASTDTKPTPTTAPAGSKVISGSMFYEHDTQTWYIYVVGTGWISIPAAVATTR